MKRWQLLLLMVLAMSLAGIAAHAQIQIPGFVKEGLVMTYTGPGRKSDDHNQGSLEPFSQTITVTMADQTMVEGTTVITINCDPKVNGGALCNPPKQYTIRTEWNCSLDQDQTHAQKCGMNPYFVGGIAQFWVDPRPANAANSIVGPNNEPYTSVKCPAEVANAGISNVNCLHYILPGSFNGSILEELWLAYDTTGLVRYSNRFSSEKGTSDGQHGSFIFTSRDSNNICDFALDFNKDLKADILWRNDNGVVGLWSSNPGSAFSFTAQILGSAGSDWHIQCVGDFDGDGRADILWRNDNGDVALWITNPPGSKQPIVFQDLGGATADWHIQGVGYFNGGSKADILWRNDAGQVALWIPNPPSFKPPVIFQNLGGAPADWHIEGIGDFKGDGKDDILWRNDNGNLRLWIPNPPSFNPPFTFQDLGVAMADSQIQGVGDFNGGGKADILWRNDNGDVALWIDPATQYTFRNLGGATADWHIQGVGDFNGGGKDDILWRHDNGGLLLWISNLADPKVPYIPQGLDGATFDWHITPIGIP